MRRSVKILDKLINIKNAIVIMLKASKLYFVIMIILSIMNSLPSIINLFIWKKILDSVYVFLTTEEKNYKLLIFYILMHFVMAIFSEFLSRINQYIRSIYSLLVEKYITNETMDAIDLMDLADLENYDIHNTIEKATGESCDKMMALLSKFMEFLEDVTSFVGMSGILISFNPLLYIIIFLSVIPMGMYSQKYFSKLFQLYDKRIEKIRFRNELKNLICRSDVFKEVKIFKNLKYIKNIINKINNDIIDEDKHEKRKLNIQGILSSMVELVLTYALKGTVIILGVVSKSSIGTIDMNMESATSIQGTTSNIVMVAISMYEDSLYLTSFSKLLQYKKQALLRKERSKETSIFEFDIESIELVDVWFKYSEDADYVIKNMNHKFVINKSYAIVGYNGEGKTTLIKIIMGLYKPQRGVVLVNGRNIDEYDMDTYFMKISAVFQDFVKYPLTVKENIAMGNIELMDNKEEIMNAARLGCADTFIEQLPNRLEEKLIRGWENSTDLSIGQWQRIAIARAYMRKSIVIIFDEPSAALDAKTESKILNEVALAKEGRIGIIITHRFLNIKKVDEIVVIHRGTIENYGTHEQLLEKNEVYAELYSAQKEMI